jgi:hypothetical protein
MILILAAALVVILIFTLRPTTVGTPQVEQTTPPATTQTQ